jgi:hypothetical protein
MGGWVGGWRGQRERGKGVVYAYEAKKKAKICFVIYIAGKRNILFIYL